MAPTVHTDTEVCPAHKNMLTKYEFWTVVALLGGALGIGWVRVPSIDRVAALENSLNVTRANLEKDQNKNYMLLQKLDAKIDRILEQERKGK